MPLVRCNELREIELAEVRVIQQRVIKRVDGRECVDLDALQLLDRARDVTRIRNQRADAAGPDRQQAAHRQREDVMQRQRDHADKLIDVRMPLVRRIQPHFGLQDVGDQIAMRKRRAFGDAGRATGVLKKRDVVGILADGCKCAEAVFVERLVEPDAAGQIPLGHHLRHAPHDEVDEQPLHAYEIAHGGDDHMLDASISAGTPAE